VWPIPEFHRQMKITKYRNDSSKETEPYPMAPGIFFKLFIVNSFVLPQAILVKTLVIVNLVNARSRKLTVREYVSSAEDLSDVRRSPEKGQDRGSP